MIQYDNGYHREFKVIAKIGLSNVEALQRIGTYGYNTIEEKINATRRWHL